MNSGIKRNKIYDLIDKTELNSIVFNAKDDRGYINYDTRVGFSEEIGSELILYDLKKVIKEMEYRNIYSIARIVLFKDSVLPKARPDLAIKDNRTGKPLYSEGSTWPDIYSQEVWDYNIEVAKELVLSGVDEIQFDYIRAPARGNISYAEYSHNTGNETKAWAITSFLKKVREETKLYNVKISADVFGMVFIKNNDQGIGQYVEEIMPYLDYIYPMTYPSHYSPYFMGYPYPEQHPYQVVKYTLEKAQERGRGTDCLIMPWIQAFGLGVKYTKKEILEQIRAAEELGINGYLFWNASNNYSIVEEAFLEM